MGVTLLVAACAPSATPTPSSAGTPRPAATASPSPTRGVASLIRGWPGTAVNPAGVYSWDGSTCAQQWCSKGFMHNGYGSGDVDIRIKVESSEPVHGYDGATAVIVAGHPGFYQRPAVGAEQWAFDIADRRVVIRMETEPGTSPADLAEAHAIVESMWTEPRVEGYGFRLIFTLATDDWDSG